MLLEEVLIREVYELAGMVECVDVMHATAKIPTGKIHMHESCMMT